MIAQAELVLQFISSEERKKEKDPVEFSYYCFLLFSETRHEVREFTEEKTVPSSYIIDVSLPGLNYSLE